MRGKYLRRRQGPALPAFYILLATAALCQGYTLRADKLPAIPEPEAPYRGTSTENGSPFPILPLKLPALQSKPEPVPEQPAEEAVPTVTQDGGSLAAGAIYLANESSFEPDILGLMGLKNPTALTGQGIEVLILHTHGTEAYTPSDGLTYEASEPERTLDPERSVVRVGTELQRVLEARGIGVVHSTALHDHPAYSGSYDRALKDIQSWLKKYPDIKVIIDLHRDSIVSSSGTKYKAAASINGQSTAQLMLVAGTDGGGLRHDHWRENLGLQLRLHDALNTAYPGLMRPVSIRNARFNQHVTYGSMLLEVGTAGNSLTEALNAVRLFGDVLADMLLQQ